MALFSTQLDIVQVLIGVVLTGSIRLKKMTFRVIRTDPLVAVTMLPFWCSTVNGSELKCDISLLKPR